MYKVVKIVCELHVASAENNKEAMRIAQKELKRRAEHFGIDYVLNNCFTFEVIREYESAVDVPPSPRFIKR